MEVTINLEDPEILQKLKIICELIFSKDAMNTKEKAFTNRPTHIAKRFLCNTPDILKILRGCLISHRFTQALPILENISPKVAPRTHGIYAKNSLFTLENLQQQQEAAKDATEFFVRHVTVLDELNKRELLLEFLMCRLRNHQFEYPVDVFQKVLFAGLKLRKNKTIDPILECYVTLFDYMAWVKAVQMSSGSESQFLEEAQNISEKVISTWTSIISKPGIWDIFMEKLIQVLLSRDEHECCDQVLRSYVKTHPDHLNAYIYLELYGRNVDKNERLLNLKKIAVMSPSDELVLDYVDILLTEQEISSALKHMFLFLDYSINKESLRGWTVLVKIVYSILLSQDHKSVIILRHLWKERSQYWIRYHFHKAGENEQQSKLCVEKCIFLCMMLKSTDHSFVKSTRKNIENCYPRRLENFTSRLKRVESLNKLQFY